MSAFIAELLGVAAGALILSSALPPAIRNLRKEVNGDRAEAVSRGMLAIGNLLWCVVGLLMGNTALTLMTGVNACINGLICAQHVRGRIRARIDGPQRNR